MAGSNDFTGQNIQDSYQRVLQISSSGELSDGTGSLVPLLYVTASHAITEVNYETSSSYAETASMASNDFNVHGHITASGNISSSGVTAASGSFHVLKGDTTAATGLSVSGYVEATHITASGNISSSGIITGEGLVISDDMHYILMAEIIQLNWEDKLLPI